MSFEALDKSVINVNGYLPSTSQLYGIDWNKRAFLVSEDQGVTWMSVSSQRFLWAKAQTGYLTAINVPWIKAATLGVATPQNPYMDPSTQWGGEAVVAICVKLFDVVIIDGLGLTYQWKHNIQLLLSD